MGNPHRSPSLNAATRLGMRPTRTSVQPTGLRLSTYYWAFNALLLAFSLLTSAVAGQVIITLYNAFCCSYWLAVYSLQRKRRIRQPASSQIAFGPATIFAALIFVWAGISLLWTQGGASAPVFYLGELLQFVISYVLCRIYPIQFVLRSACKGSALGIAASLPLFVAFAGFSGGGRLGGTAMFSGISTSACLGIMAVVYLGYTRGVTKFWAGVLAGSYCLTLYLAFGKTEIIALLATTVFFALIAPGSAGRRLMRFVWMALGIGVALLILRSKIDTYLNRATGGVETLTGRTLLWAKTYSQIVNGPWLRGYGFMSFRKVGPLLQYGTDQLVHAHNDFLTVWFNFGLIGVALVFGCYFAFGYTAFRALRRGGGAIAALVFCSVVFSLIRGLTEANSQLCIYPLPWLLLFDCEISTYLARAIGRVKSGSNPSGGPRSRGTAIMRPTAARRGLNVRTGF